MNHVAARSRSLSNAMVACGAASLGAVVGSLLAAPAGHAAAAAPATTLVSVNRDGTGSANARSVAPSISANGRIVAFQSRATDLTTQGAARGNIYVRDQNSGLTTLVSLGGTGGGGNGDSQFPAVSGNGRFVAFQSTASDLTASDPDGRSDILVRDLVTRTTTLASVNAAGPGGGNGESYAASMSGSGRLVAFMSGASDLVAGDSNNSDDVLVRDLKLGTTTLVSVNLAGVAPGNGASSFPKLSGNGRFVGFASTAEDLVANDANGLRDVFLRDLRKRTTALVSVNAAGTASANGRSGDATVSANGRFVAFGSNAIDLVAGKANPEYDIFVRDMKSGATRLVSVNAGGTGGGNGESFNPAISADGRYVLFVSRASDLVPNDGNGQGDIFLRDVKTGTTTLVSVNASGTGAGNGPSGNFGYPYLAAKGRIAVFDSAAADLAPNDANGADDIFVRILR